MKEILNKIEESFKKSMRGEEDLKIVIRYWGIIGYLVAYFILNKIIKMNNIVIIDNIIAAIAIAYFAWHFYILIKCSPKKPHLTKEEEKELGKKRRAELFKSFTRKLLLQESFTKWNPVLIAQVTDLLCITHFFIFLGN